MMSSKRGLGRGLSALMADVRHEDESPGRATAPDREIPIESVRPNPNQPRRHFDPEALEELASSIRELGIIQPLVVRPVGDGYEIVAGERRWRAAQMAQKHSVPVVIRDYVDREVLQIAIVENVQRADLNPMDEATGYATLIEQYGHSQEQVAEAVGKSRSHIANLVRLLQLPESVQSMLIDGRLTSGHARALIGLPNAASLAETAVRKQLSVRDVEKMARAEKSESPRRQPVRPEKDADTLALEGDLSASLGMAVKIDHRGKGGVLTVSYGTFEELDRLCDLLNGVLQGAD
jgi:ParB family chromosome partitioning protein